MTVCALTWKYVHISGDYKIYFFIWMQILDIRACDCFLKSLHWRILFSFSFYVLVLLFKAHDRWQVIPTISSDFWNSTENTTLQEVKHQFYHSTTLLQLREINSSAYFLGKAFKWHFLPSFKMMIVLILNGWCFMTN